MKLKVKYITCICIIFSLLLVSTGCRNYKERSVDVKKLTYNNDIFTEDLFRQVEEIDFWNGGEAIEITRASDLEAFYGYLATLVLSPMDESEPEKSGHQLFDIITKDNKLSFGILSGEFVTEDERYQTNLNIVDLLRTVAEEVEPE